MSNLTRNLVLASLLLPNLVADARAGSWNTCGTEKLKWTLPQVSMVVRQSDFPEGSDFGDAIEWAANRWSSTASNIGYKVTFVPDEPDLFEDENDVSEIYLVDNLDAPARTFTWKVDQTCTITEADILINSTHAWTTSTDADDLISYFGSDRPFQTMMLHELGHAQGLAHDGDTYSVMGEDYNHIHLNDGIATAYLGEVDIAQSVDTYGAKAGVIEDVGLAHWKRIGFTGGSDGYSLYGRTALVSTDGTPIYHDGDKLGVDVGAELKMEVAVENFGKSDQVMNIGWYLSSNDDISTGDFLLATQGVLVLVDEPELIQSPVLALPSDLPSKTDFWIGAVIDYDEWLPEQNEWNNRTQIAIHTNPLPKDLVAVSIAGPNFATPGEKAFVTTTIENAGDEFAGEFTYEIRLSQDQNITVMDPLLYSNKTTKLGAELHAITMPNIPPGPWFWALRVLGDESESDLTNNDVIGDYVLVNPPPPNLFAISVSGPASASVGDKVNLQASIGHSGAAVIGPIGYTIVLSLDANPTLGRLDPRLGHRGRAGRVLHPRGGPERSARRRLPPRPDRHAGRR